MTSFTYGRIKAKRLGITCRCHLSTIMPDQYYASIFYDSMVSVTVVAFSFEGWQLLPTSA